MTTPPRDALLDKVRKLLTQAEDPACTPAEAETFNAKAVELIARYGIEAALLANAGQSRETVGRRTITVDPPYVHDKATMLGAIAVPLRCQVLYSNHSRRAEVFGYEVDLEHVELLYTSLLLQATTQLVRVVPPEQNVYGRRESTAAYRRSWFDGFAMSIYYRLLGAEQRAEAKRPTTASGTSTALVLADRQQQVAQAVTDAYPHQHRARERRLSGTGFDDGVEAAKRADLGATRVGDQRPEVER